MPLPADKKVCIESESSTGEYTLVKSVTRSYRLHEFASRAAAELALLTDPSCPLLDPDYPILIRKPFSVKSNSKIEDEFTAEVTWERFEPEQVDRERISGSISLSQQNVKTTFNHIGSYSFPGATPMDAGGLINVTKDGANGVDLDIPVMSFTISRLYDAGTFSIPWLANANQFIGLPNSLPWRNFGVGEIRIAGVDGSEGDGEFDEISFSFEASPTFTNLVIPSPLGDITIPQKLGWQYLHLNLVKYTDPGNKFTTQIPHTAHVEEISEFVDINGLIA